MESISDKLEDLGEKVEDFKLEQSYIRSQRKIVRRQNIEQAKADYRLRFEQLAENLKAQEKYFAEHAQDTAENLQERVKKQSELSNIRTAMTEFNAKRRIERQQKSYRHAQSILKRNGSAISKKYADALNELKQTKDKNAKTSEGYFAHKPFFRKERHENISQSRFAKALAHACNNPYLRKPGGFKLKLLCFIRLRARYFFP